MTKMTPLIRIGTRGSKLALIQANETRDRLAAAHDELREDGAIALEIITTTGDRVRDRPLAEIGGKGLFEKEIEDALQERRIDIAVHSLKDCETVAAEGTVIECVLEREDPRDAFLSPVAGNIDQLPEGAVIGTASVRRQALLLHRRPDLKCVLFRGNVDTRLAKLTAGEVDATLLAFAGLKRMGLADQATRVLELDEMPTAVAQGAIGVQCRLAEDGPDARIRGWLAAINHEESRLRVTAERSMLATLDGSCRTPIAGLATLDGDGRVTLVGHVAALDGSALHRAEAAGTADEAVEIGARVGQDLIQKAGPDFRV